ncbi:MAG: hypothetical protein R3E61_08200 [Pseudomonadales bacterium]
MRKTIITAAALSSLFWMGSALADASCAVRNDGNTWNLVCADDGQGDDEYQCSFQLSVTNADGEQDSVDASGSVAKGASEIIIWSGIDSNSSNITGVNVVGGECASK